jgi:hypothetical protein
MRIATVIWLPCLLLLASCRDQPEDVRLSSAVVIGPYPTVFTGSRPLLPTHGHEVLVRVYPASSYHRDSVRFPDGKSWGYKAFVDERGREIQIQTTLIARDTSRIVLHNGHSYAADIRRFQPTGVEITATVPVRLDSVQWWAGDLRPRWGGP